MAVTNRTQLIDYVLRRLGFPVIQINVSDDQVNDRVDDAIRFNIDYNYNMTEKKFLAIKISQTDLDNNYVTVPEDVLAITRILPFRTNNSSSSNFLFDLRYHITANALLNTYATGDISQFYITKQYIATMNDIFINQPMYEFRRYTDKLYFHFDATDKVQVDDYLVIECYTPIDVNSRFWDDRLLLDYATALVKKQWASNLSKYQSVQLPGGVTLNGTELYNQAVNEIEKIEQNIKDYSEPVPFFIG